MAITYSTPYKNNTVASVSGTTFTSNGTPFVAGDVGRFLVITSGAAIGQIRLITGYTSSTVVTVDLAWDVSNISAFTDTAPSAGATWQMNLTLDDIDDGTHIIKDSTNSYRMVAAAGVVTLSGVFVADISKNFVIHAGNFKLSTTSYAQFGYLHPNGYALYGCGLIDISTTTNGISNSTGNGNSGDLHLYGCNVSSSLTSSQFWRLYRSNSHIVRFVDCDFSGGFGARVQGTRSALIRCTYRGSDSSGGLAGIGAVATFGLIEECRMQGTYQGIYCAFSLGVGTVTSPVFDDITGAIFRAVLATVDGTYVIQDYVETEVTTAAAVIICDTARVGSVLSFRQFINTALVNTSLTAITDTARRAIRNGALTIVDDVTTTSGTFSRYTATMRDFSMTIGTIAWAAGTDYGPFDELIACYGYNPQSLALPLATSNNATFTMLPDTGVTANLATALAYSSKFTIDGSGHITVIANATLDELYDYAQAWLQSSGTNMALAGAGLKLISSSGTTISTTKNLTISATFTLSNGTKFNTFSTTGTTTITGAMAVDKYVNSTGTFVKLAVSGLVSGSRIQLYNVTDSTEIYNAVVAATSYYQYLQYTSDKSIRLRATYISGVTAKYGYESLGTLVSTGLTFTATQEDDLIYNTFAIDGSTVTGFTADYVDDEVDLTVGTNFNLTDLYAWWVYNQTTSQGISDFFGGLTAVDEGNFRINSAIVSAYLDNTTATTVWALDNRRFFRSDGLRPIRFPTTGGGDIDVEWRDPVLFVNENDITTIKNDMLTTKKFLALK